MRIGSLSIVVIGVGAAAFVAAEFWPRGSTSFASAPGITSAAPPARTISRYSGLPLPRFVSLKTSKVNVRRGPSRKHPIAWSFRKKGMPIEIVTETENWRHVRDAEGSEGWIYQGLLSGARTVIVAPWDSTAIQALHADPSAGSAVRANFESGVVAKVKQCNGTWCKIASGGYDGWISQTRVWGVYPGEVVD